MKRILIADDKEENLYLLRSLLETENYLVLSAANGSEALDLLRNTPCDIIVSDILMPVMDGFALCIECKKDPKLRQIPFIFYTATYTDPKDEAFALGLGADRFLTKPLEPEIIVKEIQQMLARPLVSVRNNGEKQEDEKVVLKLYNQTLVRKLETKMAELELLNTQLKEQIAEQKRTQKKLRKSEKLIREITASIPGVVYQFQMEPDGKMFFSFVSDGANEILNVSPEAIYGDAQKAFSMVHPEELKSVMESIQESASTISPWSKIFRATMQPGVYKWIQGVSVPQKLENGNILWNGTFFDYSEIKEYQTNLENKNSELIKANDELDRFVYSASHDMRAPLTSLMGLINLTKEETANDEMQLRLDMMNETVVKLDDFIRKILDYSRNKRQEIIKESIAWDTLIDDCWNSVKFHNTNKKCVFNKHIQQMEDFYSDKNRISIVLNNLLANALKYSDCEKPAIEITVDVNAHEGKAIVKIADNGIGISEEHQERIFEMFFRATNISTGSGLGLYIAKDTIEKLGGRLWLSSELGTGTTFYLEIPNAFLYA